MKTNHIIRKYEGIFSIVNVLKQKNVDFIRDIPTSENKHFKYLDGYFKTIGVKSLVFEINYVDKHYLQDYSSYYSFCYSDYRKKCIRLHTFDVRVNRNQFFKYLTNIKEEDDDRDRWQEYLNNHYCGFIVFRPLPLTLFGRTCLKTYPKEDKTTKGSSRYYRVKRKYKANLFGIPLSVTSIGFQEQDMAVAACATSALWSAFQGTGSIFEHSFPSPYEITKSATAHFIYSSRNFPTKGLNIQQMATAIKYLKMEPQLFNYVERSYFKAHLRAYLKGGIPVIIGLQLVDVRNTLGKILPNGNPYYGDNVGLHAVTVLGYCTQKNGMKEFKLMKEDEVNNVHDIPHKFFLRSERIEKLYVHDDQIGPFAMMEFITETQENSSIYQHEKDHLTTSWADLEEKKYKNVHALPNAILIPLYHKIRIPFKKIKSIVLKFDALVLALIQDVKFEWDIYISTVSEFKKNVRSFISLDNNAKFDLLTRDFPKYIWIAETYVDNINTFTFIFDATDVENGKLFICSLHYDNRFQHIEMIAKNKEIYDKQDYTIKAILDEYNNFKTNRNIYFAKSQAKEVAENL